MRRSKVLEERRKQLRQPESNRRLLEIRKIKHHHQGGLSMRDNVLWRKQSHIIMMLAETLNIDAERALDLYYSTQTARQLSDARYSLQLMSDHYILDDILEEIRK
jgi:hypothetical protein